MENRYLSYFAGFSNFGIILIAPEDSDYDEASETFEEAKQDLLQNMYEEASNIKSAIARAESLTVDKVEI